LLALSKQGLETGASDAAAAFVIPDLIRDLPVLRDSDEEKVDPGSSPG